MTQILPIVDHITQDEIFMQINVRSFYRFLLCYISIHLYLQLLSHYGEETRTPKRKAGANEV